MKIKDGKDNQAQISMLMAKTSTNFYSTNKNKFVEWIRLATFRKTFLVYNLSSVVVLIFSLIYNFALYAVKILWS